MNNVALYRPVPGQLGAFAQATAIACAGVACTMALFARDLLPSRFLLDDAHIQGTMNSAFADSKAESFKNIAAVYSELGLAGQPALAALITLLLFSAAVFAAIRWTDLARFGFIGMAMLIISFALAVVYLGQYSKESVSLAVVLLLMLLPRGILFDVAFASVCVGYGLLLRPYWMIVAALYLLWRVALPRIRHPLWIPVLVLGTYLVLEQLFQWYFGFGIGGHRQLVNEGRSDVEVGSLIQSPFLEAEGLLAAPAAAAMLFGLLLPMQLFVSGSLYHLASGLVITFLWVAAGAGVWHLMQRQQQTAAGVRSNGGDNRTSRAVRAGALLLAFVTVQAVFEPDFGSYLKHLTALLPLFLALLPLREMGRLR
ncbi:hypothetical protein [Arthrobacter pigmenti]